MSLFSFLALWFGPVNERAIQVPMSEPSSPKHEAAVKLQKVYKSFRMRRQLADCAVLVEQRWWKLLDFALLRRSSVSFFDIEMPESAVSKWSRAKSRAAKVGKGLSKNEKARKLALQHWLEAIDPRHRYGDNLHFYYDSWLRCESRQPFFYWRFFFIQTKYSEGLVARWRTYIGISLFIDYLPIEANKDCACYCNIVESYTGEISNLPGVASMEIANN